MTRADTASLADQIDASDLSVLDAMARHLDDFEAALARIRERYPRHRLERPLREHSLPAYLRVDRGKP